MTATAKSLRQRQSRLLSLLCLAAALLPFGSAAAQGSACLPCRTTPTDSLLAVRILDSLKAHPEAQMGELVLRSARALDGQPYVAGTLEETPDEQLTLFLTRTDCILYVETCLGLARTARRGGDFDDLKEEIRQSRYRDGVLTCYEDRLHYTTDWAREGVRRGTLVEVTPSLGPTRRQHPIDFMSTHPESYPRMRDPARIRSIEQRLSAEPLRYIPTSELERALPGIRTGDILLFVARRAGLDVLHTGLARVCEDGTVHLQHASSAAGKVLEDPKTLSEYLAGRPSIAGLSVFRATDPGDAALAGKESAPAVE